MKDLFGEDRLVTLRSQRRAEKKQHRRTTEVLEITAEEEWRRAYGVQQLLKVMGMSRPVAGKCYHIISGGNVDLLAHVRWLLLHWKRFSRVFISAWSISATDILLLNRWHEEGMLGSISLLVGDIYPNSYKKEWERLRQMYDDGVIEKLYSATIHSKLLLLEAEDGECVVVESSANCNMNPRVEQSVVTVSRGLYEFYMKYFNELFESHLIVETNKELMKMQVNEPSDISGW